MFSSLHGSSQRHVPLWLKLSHFPAFKAPNSWQSVNSLLKKSKRGSDTGFRRTISHENRVFSLKIEPDLDNIFNRPRLFRQAANPATWAELAGREPRLNRPAIASGHKILRAAWPGLIFTLVLHPLPGVVILSSLLSAGGVQAHVCGF